MEALTIGIYQFMFILSLGIFLEFSLISLEFLIFFKIFLNF